MRKDVLAFWMILAVNTIVTIVYFIAARLSKRHVPGLAARCAAMLLFPVVGPLYFGVGWVLRKIFFHKPVELTDVIFSKEREKTLLKANEASESGVVPAGDAVTIVDRSNARTAVLEMLRHNVRSSFSGIFRALDSDDSEISHYAASMLQSELGKFRVVVQKIAEELEQTEEELRQAEDYDGQMKTAAGRAFAGEEPRAEDAPPEGDEDRQSGRGAERHKQEAHAESEMKDSDDPKISEDYSRHEQAAYKQGMQAYYGTDENPLTLEEKLNAQVDAAHELIEDLSGVLRQRVLPEMESRQLTELADRTACLVRKRDILSASEGAKVAECWLLQGDMEKGREWSDYLSRTYPETLEAYSTELRLLYETGEWNRFSETLERLKSSGIPLDSEMMELVRAFG